MRLAKLHLVPKRVAEKRGMVLDLCHRGKHFAFGAREGGLVEVVEAVVVVSKPEAKHHGVAVLLRLVEIGLGSSRPPCAEGVAADLLEKRLRSASACPMNEVRPTVEFFL